MSTLTISNLNDGTTTVPTTYITNGSAKAWLNLNGTGTIAIRDSLNTSSVTDESTGKYTQTYVSNMSSDDYSVSTSAGSDRGYIETVKVNRYNQYEPIYNNGMQVVTYNNSSSYYDTHFVLLQSFGDLA